ncbi:MAG: hypothetical protein EBT63_00320 [Proteobacteria bacterium]|nr:hypothetical protein [Pseudomonadota bacterium]NCA28338.1 hypothetical protein [Pseudomonadota bacterium]
MKKISLILAVVALFASSANAQTPASTSASNVQAPVAGSVETPKVETKKPKKAKAEKAKAEVSKDVSGTAPVAGSVETPKVETKKSKKAKAEVSKDASVTPPSAVQVPSSTTGERK